MVAPHALDAQAASGRPGTPMRPDPGRPWGWAVRAYMDNPGLPLYNTTKQKLLDGRQVFSHAITRFDVEEYCTQAPNYDYSRFEMQHTNLRFDEIEAMMAACPHVGSTPMIRIPEASEANVQKAVDLGALGIIVPTVDDAIQARESARYARFPPAARRSTGGGAASLWAPRVPDGMTYRETANDNMLVVVMIETVEAVNNALEIASQPGVDVVMIGNADLASFSGFEQGTPEYLELLARVRDAAYLAGKFWGNANSSYSAGNPHSPDSRFHMSPPPGQ